MTYIFGRHYEALQYGRNTGNKGIFHNLMAWRLHNPVVSRMIDKSTITYKICLLPRHNDSPRAIDSVKHQSDS